MYNYILKTLGMVQHSKQTKQIVFMSQHSTSKTPEEWYAYWQAQDQPWRTEPEIDTKRQKELAQCRATMPDIEKGIYPFKGMKLSRADVEWLLATHENGQGPVDWSDESQRGREGIDMRGADLRQVDLSGLPLACMIGGLNMMQNQAINSDHRRKAAVALDGANLRNAHLEGAILYNASVRGAALQGAFLQIAKVRWARMEGSRMRGVHLEGADLRSAHLEGNTLAQACLDGTDLRSAFFDAASSLTTLGSKEATGLVSGVRWGGVERTRVDWSQVIMLGDERIAKKQTNRDLRLASLHQAVRAYRKLAVELQEQGLNDEAARFAYRAHVLQKSVRRFQILQSDVKLRQRMQALGIWLFSWFLFLLAGYGYKPVRSFLAYLFVIFGFAASYYLLGLPNVGPHHLVWYEAIVVSMTAFHGRGFFADQFRPGDPQAFVAAFEAFVGLIIEVTFIATLTRRLFGQ
jgi:uncharacterized protein YjbI with pentapeptide repeats